MSEICSVCKKEFASENEYLDHVCQTGFTPRDPKHLGEDFMRVSKTAIERGEKRKELEATGMKPKEAQKKAQVFVAEANAQVA